MFPEYRLRSPLPDENSLFHLLYGLLDCVYPFLRRRMSGDDSRGILALGQLKEHRLYVDHCPGIVPGKMHNFYPFAIRLQFIIEDGKRVTKVVSLGENRQFLADSIDPLIQLLVRRYLNRSSSSADRYLSRWRFRFSG
jgi:hypothetical protein